METGSSICERPGSAALALCVCLAVCALVRSTEAGWSTLVDNGQPPNRVDMVFVGDGYTQANLSAGVYTGHVQSYVDYMFGTAAGSLSEPFPRYRKFFNVHQIDVASQESGADNSPFGVLRNTALDARYWTDGIERLLTIDPVKASQVASQHLAGTGITLDMRLATVNDSRYGGSGGMWATFAGNNPQTHDLALHELSHSFSGTIDEYEGFVGTYPHGEPAAPNATTDPTGSKWSHWLGFEDPRGDYLDIGAFQGAAFYSLGVYRPALDSKMRTLGTPFNAVVREETILDIYNFVRPVDQHRGNEATVETGPLWVEVVDPAVIQVDWYVNGALVDESSAAAFDLNDFSFPSGTYAVRAHAYDRILDHAGNGSMLDLVRKDFHKLQQEIEWTVAHTAIVPLPGDYNLDGLVNSGDFGVWKSNFGSTSDLNADGDGNGQVDAADYTIWRDNLGSLPAGSSASNAPEPAALVYSSIALAIASGAMRGRRRLVGPVPANCRCV